MADQVSTRDASPVNAAMFEDEAAFYSKRFEYLIQRRDQLLDRLRFGVLGVNAASLLALIAALSGRGEAAAWFGLNPPRAQVSTACFLAGAVAAGIAMMFDARLHRAEPADAFARRTSAAVLVALYQGQHTPENYEHIGKQIEAYHRLPLVDFQFSPTALWLQAAAGACWLGGITVPLLHLLGWT